MLIHISSNIKLKLKTRLFSDFGIFEDRRKIIQKKKHYLNRPVIPIFFLKINCFIVVVLDFCSNNGTCYIDSQTKVGNDSLVFHAHKNECKKSF